jgi:hypothetical protein
MSTGLEIGVNVFFFVGAAIALGYAIHLTRKSKQWWAVHASSALPVALALNSTQSRVLTNLGSLITIGIAIFYTWCFGRALELSAAVTHPASGTVADVTTLEPAIELSLA